MVLLITVFFIFLLCVPTYSLPIFIPFWRGMEQIGIKKRNPSHLLPSLEKLGMTIEQLLFSYQFLTRPLTDQKQRAIQHYHLNYLKICADVTVLRLKCQLGLGVSLFSCTFLEGI